MIKQTKEYNPFNDIIKLMKQNLNKAVSYNKFAHGKEHIIKSFQYDNSVPATDNQCSTNDNIPVTSIKIERQQSLLNNIHLIEEFDLNKLINLHKYYTHIRDVSHATIIHNMINTYISDINGIST